MDPKGVLLNELRRLLLDIEAFNNATDNGDFCVAIEEAIQKIDEMIGEDDPVLWPVGHFRRKGRA